MEDDEEIQSHPSPDTGSPPPPPPNGRITVTVAAAPPPNTLALALPIQQPRASGNSGGREDCWSEGATSVLIDAWGERYLELSRGNLKQNHWKEVADIVSSREDYTKTPKTDVQCKNRIDTVKKKYKAEKSKIAVGGGPSKWPFFGRLDQLIGPTAKIGSASASASASPAVTSARTPSLTSGSHKVPTAIPVGVRSVHQFQQHQHHRKKQKQQSRRRAPVDSDSSRSEPEPPSPDSSDSFPPESYERKRPRIHRELNPDPAHPVPHRRTGVGESKENWGNSVRELTRAILKFGEAYEQAESSRLQQLMEMEKQRMKFAKDLELQRMQFFMKTQLELSQLKNRRVAGRTNHHSINNNSNHNNNNSDCSI